MIELIVEEYCHDCLDFTANVTPPHREPHDWQPGYYITNTVIECKNRNRCANIRRYLERKMKGEKG